MIVIPSITLLLLTLLHCTHATQQQCLFPAKLSTLSWNLAAINQNPFEYHIGQASNNHTLLMEKVARFVQVMPHDLPLSDIFSPTMFQELIHKMKDSQHYDTRQIQVVISMWKTDYSKRLSISQFLKDIDLGKKRLISYPDRMTNTIRVEGVIGKGRGTGHQDGSTHPRPTVINCYNGTSDHFDSMEVWWKEWQRFMFDDIIDVDGDEYTTPHQLLQPISRMKYPSLSIDEESVSVPLQTLILALFDAVLIHSMLFLYPNQSHLWHQIRIDTCTHLVWNKSKRAKSILETTYRHVDLLFLQEASAEFVNDMYYNSKLFKALLLPENGGAVPDGIRNQNSIVLIKKGSVLDQIVSVKGTVVKDVSKEMKVKGLSRGDLYAVLVEPSLIKNDDDDDDDDSDECALNVARLFVSFHGDTNGLLSIPLLRSIQQWVDNYNTQHYEKNKIDVVIGMDANTYGKYSKKNKQNLKDYIDVVVKEMKMTTWLGNVPNLQLHTTYNGRTFLQPQLNKAMTKEEVQYQGDRNLKDFILFDGNGWNCQNPIRDNTGKGEYVEEMVYPTTEWPSDHSAVSCVLEGVEGGGKRVEL